MILPPIKVYRDRTPWRRDWCWFCRTCGRGSNGISSQPSALELGLAHYVWIHEIRPGSSADRAPPP